MLFTVCHLEVQLRHNSLGYGNRPIISTLTTERFGGLYGGQEVWHRLMGGKGGTHSEYGTLAKNDFSPMEGAAIK